MTTCFFKKGSEDLKEAPSWCDVGVVVLTKLGDAIYTNSLIKAYLSPSTALFSSLYRCPGTLTLPFSLLL